MLAIAQRDITFTDFKYDTAEWLQSAMIAEYKSTSRSQLCLNPLHRQKTPRSGHHFVNKGTLLRYSLFITE